MRHAGGTRTGFRNIRYDSFAQRMDGGLRSKFTGLLELRAIRLAPPLREHVDRIVEGPGIDITSKDRLVAPRLRTQAFSCERSMRSRQQSTGPGFDVVECHVPTDPLKILVVPGHEHATGFTTRQRQQDIVRERLRHAADLEAFRPCHLR